MFTLICARLGDGDLAIPLIERLLRTPHGLGYRIYGSLLTGIRFETIRAFRKSWLVRSQR